MKMYSMILTLLLIGCCANVYAQNKSSSQDAGEKIWVWRYLPDMANRLDCYYTLETKNTPSQDAEPSTDYVVDDVRIKTVGELVRKLQSELPNFIVTQDAERPKVIHLKAKSLVSQENYPLEKRISISYSGRLAMLPDAIGSYAHMPLITQSVFFNSIISEDHFTKVKFEAKNRIVRNILTDCVPLLHYSRLIWSAETITRNGETYTQVNYNGVPAPVEPAISANLPH